MDDEIKLLTDDELETLFLDDTYKMYLNEIRKYPILSVEQQKKLGRRYKENGDLKAKELLINCNLRLVVSVANRYKERLNHFQVLDVVQEGNLGLIRAVETYDPDQGAFTTYAIPWIKEKITRGLAEKGQEIRKPVSFINAKTKYLRLIEENNARGLPLPTDEEICDILNISSETLKNIKDSSNGTMVSLNQTIDDDEKSELGYFVPATNNEYDDVLNQIDRDELLFVFKEILNPLQYFIIYHRILREEQKTLEEIAHYLNITRERVRQIEAKALDKLRPYMLEDSKVYTRTLNKIRQREGKNFKFLKTTPVSPIQIIKYMYLEDDLTDLERKVYELKLLGKYNYKEENYALILGISTEELKQVIISLKEKINKKFSNINKFKNYQDQMRKTYGTQIFNIYINSQNKQGKLIDYHAISEKYSSLSLDEILGYFNDVNYNLTPDEEDLIKRYFGVCNSGYYIKSKEIEKEINVLKYGFIRKDKRVPLKKLYKEYLRIKDKFNAEQQLYLETYIFNKKDRILFEQTYPESSLPKVYYYLIDVLEKSYYNIHEYFENNFTKENWLEIKEKYSYLFTEERIKLLDLYYGVNGKPYTITELSEKYNIDYRNMIDLCRQARDLAINLYSGIKLKLDIDKSLYAPYIIDLRYNFTDETRNVLKLFIIENKSYDEISNITGLNKTRISNIITEGIRKIDNYRFEIIKPSIIGEEELSDIFEYYGDKIPPIEKEVIRLKHLKYMENNDIASLVDKSLLEINRIVRHFNILYENYTVRNVTLTYEDILDEISKHKSESIWTEEQKEFASFYYGVKSKYNISGEKLNSAELMEKFGYNKNVYYNTSRNIISSLKARKINFIKPENNYIPRQKLDELLDDVHLPISEKEREIICHLFELKGFSYMTINQLSEKYKEKSGSVRRRYQRAIVSIYKYINNEIDGIIHYETDIVPILKYFGISDRKKIEDSFKNGLTYEEIAKKYGITFDQVVTTMNRIRSNIKDLMTNPNAKKFDFDYYLEAVNNPNLPFSGDLNLARRIFDLVFGMNGEKTSYPLVIEKLNLDINTSMISKTLYNLMLSVCKLKDGITKDKTFTYEQVYSYYLSHYDTMSDYCKDIYQNYFEKLKKYKPISSSKVKLPYYIISDLIMDTYPDAFVLEKATKEEVLDILKKYGKKINKRVRNELMGRYDIPERKFMNGKDINHVFKILDTLDAKRKELGTSTLVLKK